MQTDTRLGSFDDVLRTATPEIAAIARFLRTLIVELHPEVVEVSRPLSRQAMLC